VTTVQALAAAADIQQTRGGLFAIAYGSHARGRARSSSDLDLLFAWQADPAPGIVDRLIIDVERLHTAHGLELDHEVAYPVKLCVTSGELTDAFGLRGFAPTVDGALTVTPVTPDPGYLNSAVFKARLILNAFTSPHTFLTGDGVAYEGWRFEAVRALCLLGLDLVDGLGAFTTADIVERLVRDPATGATGEDWLGYVNADAPHLYGTIAMALPDLVSDGVAAPSNGTLWRQNDRARRSVILTVSARWRARAMPL
jgi:arginyl-tRNA synthetase